MQAKMWIGIEWNIIYMYTFTKKIYMCFFQKNIHTRSHNNTQFFVPPLSNSENHEYMKYF